MAHSEILSKIELYSENHNMEDLYRKKQTNLSSHFNEN